MKSTALIIATLAAAAWAPVATAQDAGGRTVVAAIQERGYMGVQIAFEEGALIVSGVLPGTPAEEAGLQAGDRILSIGDLATKNQEQVEAFLAGTTVGQVLALHVERGDQHADMRIRLVSFAAVQPELVEVPVPTRRLVRAAPSETVTIVQTTETDVATDRLQSSRVQAITKLRADARLRAMDQRSQAERERGRQIDEMRLRSAARVDATEEKPAAQRRAELRERADARKVRADARREAVAARKRAEDREAVSLDRSERRDVVDGTAGDERLDELRRELQDLRTELDRLRAQIRKLSRETDR